MKRSKCDRNKAVHLVMLPGATEPHVHGHLVILLPLGSQVSDKNWAYIFQNLWRKTTNQAVLKIDLNAKDLQTTAPPKTNMKLCQCPLQRRLQCFGCWYSGFANVSSLCRMSRSPSKGSNCKPSPSKSWTANLKHHNLNPYPLA